MIHCKKCLTVFTNSVGSGTVLCKECQDKVEKDIFDTQPTCGERYAKAAACIKSLEDVVRELVKELPSNQCMCGKTQYLLGKIVTCRICLLKAKALELLNGGK